MSDQPPQRTHQDIFSHWRVSHNTIFIAVIPVLAFSVVLVVAAWPHLGEIWLMMQALAYTVTLCLMAIGVIVVVYMGKRFQVKMQHLERQSRFLTWDAGAAWINDAGELIHLSAQHEQAKLPAPSVKVSEVTGYDPNDAEVIERSKILTLRAKGKSLREIEKELEIPYNRIQKVCAAAKDLVIEK